MREGEIMSKKRQKATSRWSDIDGRSAFVIPLSLLRHPSFKMLSANACKMLLTLASQYTGFNNGYLCGAWTLAKERGWASPTTAREALLELEHYKMVERTQQGGRNKPNLYAFTFRRVDEQEGRPPLDSTPTMSSGNQWKEGVDRPYIPQPRKKLHR